MKKTSLAPDMNTLSAPCPHQRCRCSLNIALVTPKYIYLYYQKYIFIGSTNPKKVDVHLKKNFNGPDVLFLMVSEAFFKKKLNIFLDTLILWSCIFLSMKILNLRGDLTDLSARNAPLLMIMISGSILARISFRSPRKVFIFTIVFFFCDQVP